MVLLGHREHLVLSPTPLVAAEDGVADQMDEDTRPEVDLPPHHDLATGSASGFQDVQDALVRQRPGL